MKWRAEPADPQEPIDAVYLWVNGRDERFQHQLRQYRPEHVPPPGRFRDNDELKFSLRSLEKYAPWIRHVYLVTSCRPHGWLETSHPKLRIVTEDALLDSAELPTFNSNALEWRLRHIPGLSRRFLYLCDDFLLGRPIATDDFVGAAGYRIHLEKRVVPEQPGPDDMYGQSLRYTNGLLSQRFGDARRQVVTHAPRFYDQAILAELERIWPDEIRATVRHRFRAPDDVVLDLLYHHYLLEAMPGRHEPVIPGDASDYAFVLLKPHWRRVVLQLATVRTHRPKFFCLNDDLPAKSTLGTWIVRHHTRHLLRSLFPEPSTFERSHGG